MEKWDHVMSLTVYFQDELITFHATSMIHYPFWSSALDANTQKFLKTLWIIPVGSLKEEKPFSFKKRIHDWLRNSISTGLLGDLAVNVTRD